MKTWNQKHLIAGVTAVVLAFSTVAFAQRGEGRRNPEKMIDRQVSVMKDQLKLTPDQETKVRTILADSGKKMHAAMEKYGRPEPGKGPTEEQRAEMKTIREDTRTQLSQVLSADQLDQWKKFQAEHGRRFRKGGDAPPKQ